MDSRELAHLVLENVPERSRSTVTYKAGLDEQWPHLDVAGLGAILPDVIGTKGRLTAQPARPAVAARDFKFEPIDKTTVRRATEEAITYLEDVNAGVPKKRSETTDC